MILYIKKILFLLFVAGAFHYSVRAQDKVQVVTRTVTKVTDIADITGITIKGEKANITFRKSASTQIKVKLLLVSKNLSRKTAEEDLKYCDYSMESRGSILFLSNGFNAKNNFKEISSNLSARYEIEVPDGLSINISNIYGDVTLSGIRANQNISVNFGQIYLKNIGGNIVVRTTFSDITGEVLNGPLKIESQNAGIKLSQVNDILNVSAKFGEINLSDVNSSVTIKGDMTKINFSATNVAEYTFNLNALKDKLSVPAEFKKSPVQKSGSTTLNYGTGKIVINITTSYNSINIK